jgi:hypothetical protein
LSGLPTIDGYSNFIEGDYVLLTAQPIYQENGIWTVGFGGWVFIPTNDGVVFVRHGSNYGGTFWASSGTSWTVTGVNLEVLAGVLSGTYVPIGSATSTNTQPYEYWVSLGSKASDSNSGEQQSPFATIAHAFATALGSGATTGVVHLGYGTFVEVPLTRPLGCSVIGPGHVLCTIQQENGGNGNTMQDQYWGNTTTVGNGGGALRGFTINGNQANQTNTCPEAFVTSSTAISSGGATLPVVSTTGFPSTGHLWIGSNFCTYTGTSGTSFTGVTCTTAFTASVEMLVTPFAAVGHGIAIQSLQTMVDDVYTEFCVGSGIAGQGVGGGGNWETKISNCKNQNNLRYGLEVCPGFSDGQVNNLVGAGNTLGDVCLREEDWQFSNYHPVGGVGVGPTFPQLQHALIVICSSLQMFKNVTLDSAAYGSVMFNAVWLNNQIDNITFEGKTISPSIATFGGGSVFQFYGNNSTSFATGLDLRLQAGPGFNFAMAIRPYTQTVGVQDLATATSIQLLSVNDLCPFGSAMGGTISISTDSIAYTGVSKVTTRTFAAATVGQTTLQVYAAPGTLNSSGIVTTTKPSAYIGSAAQEITYTGMTGPSSGLYTLTGIPASGAGSIQYALPAGTGIAQHFITGCSGGALTSVADSTIAFQTGRSIPAANVWGAFYYDFSGGIQASPVGGASGLSPALKQSGFIGGHPNPAVGEIGIASGGTTASFSHSLTVAPAWFQVTPQNANPGQFFYVTTTSTQVTVTLVGPAANTVNFQVICGIGNQ